MSIRDFSVTPGDRGRGAAHRQKSDSRSSPSGGRSDDRAPATSARTGSPSATLSATAAGCSGCMSWRQRQRSNTAPRISRSCRTCGCSTPSYGCTPAPTPHTRALTGPESDRRRCVIPRKDVAMPKRFPAEFKRDVVRVARRGDLMVSDVAHDFGVSQDSVRLWVRQSTSTTASGTGRPARSSPSWSSCGVRSAGWRRRTRSFAGRGLLRVLLAPEVGFPLIPDLAPRVAGAVDLRGARLLGPGLLLLAGQAGQRPGSSRTPT